MQETSTYTHKQTVEVDGLRYLYFKDHRKIDLTAVREHDAVIIECSDNVLSRRFLEQFRSSEEIEIYLKPVVLYDRSRFADRIAKTACDVLITDMDSLRGKDEKIRLILDRLNEHE